jgi:fumarate hydratase class II
VPEIQRIQPVPVVSLCPGTSESFGNFVACSLTGLTGFPFINVSNKFQELNTYNIMVEFSGALNALAVCLSE